MHAARAQEDTTALAEGRRDGGESAPEKPAGRADQYHGASTRKKLEELKPAAFHRLCAGPCRPSPSRRLSPASPTSTCAAIVGDANTNHSGPLPSVGTYLDEQPITTIQGLARSAYLRHRGRIEVLPGPQGTLYGASSEAGTLRIITNKPDPTGFKAGYDLQANTIRNGTAGGIARRVREPAAVIQGGACGSSAGTSGIRGISTTFRAR